MSVEKIKTKLNLLGIKYIDFSFDNDLGIMELNEEVIYWDNKFDYGSHLSLVIAEVKSDEGFEFYREEKGGRCNNKEFDRFEFDVKEMDFIIGTKEAELVSIWIKDKFNKKYDKLEVVDLQAILRKVYGLDKEVGIDFKLNVGYDVIMGKAVAKFGNIWIYIGVLIDKVGNIFLLDGAEVTTNGTDLEMYAEFSNGEDRMLEYVCIDGEYNIEIYWKEGDDFGESIQRLKWKDLLMGIRE